MRRSGFILIQLLIATLIAAMLATSLLVAMVQMMNVRDRIDNFASTHERVALVASQLERDLAGVFIPVQSELLAPEKPATPPPAAAQQAQSEEETKKKRIANIFYGTQKDDNLEVLSFISNNPMQVFWSDKVGKAKPRVARMVYKLVPDKKIPGSFVLMRQEDDDLNLDSYLSGDKKDQRIFSLISGIKEMRVRYLFKPEDEKKEKEEKDEGIDYQRVKSWVYKKDQKDKTKAIPPVPEFVEVQLVLWDTRYKKSTRYSLLFAIPTDVMAPLRKKSQAVRLPQAQQPAAQQAAKPGAPAASAPQAGQAQQTTTGMMVQVRRVPAPGTLMSQAPKRPRGDKKTIRGLRSAPSATTVRS